MARHGTRMRSTCEETSRRPGRNNKVVSSISRVEYAFRTRPPGRTKGEEEDEQGKKEKTKEKEADKGRERRKRETGVGSSWATLETGPGRSRRKGRAGVLPSGSCLPPGTSRPAGGRASCCRFTFSRIMCPSAARARKYVCTHHRVPVYTRRMVSRCIFGGR